MSDRPSVRRPSVRAVRRFSKPKGSGTAGPTSMSLGTYILWVSGDNYYKVEYVWCRNFFFVCFHKAVGLRRAAAFVSSPIHLLLISFGHS